MKKSALLFVLVLAAVCAAVLCAAAVYTKAVKPVIKQYEEKPETQNASVTASDEELNEYTEYISGQASAVQGQVQWGIHLYGSDFSYTEGFGAVPSASVIKVFIMEYIYAKDGTDGVSLSDTAGGYTVRDLVFSMITRSDNSATNLLIDYTGMDTLNAYFKEQGYQDTSVERKMLDTKAQSMGKDNYTSVNDVMQFADRLYISRNEYPYSEMLNIMKKQQVRTKIPLMLPSGVTVANKTGELSNVENDIGIVFTEQGDFAAVFLCSSLADTGTARRFISESTLYLYEKTVGGSVSQ